MLIGQSKVVSDGQFTLKNSGDETKLYCRIRLKMLFEVAALPCLMHRTGTV